MLKESEVYICLSAILANRAVTQRTLASLLGVSLGKTNSIMKELIKEKLVKVNIRSYSLTKEGIRRRIVSGKKQMENLVQERIKINQKIRALQKDLENVCL